MRKRGKSPMRSQLFFCQSFVSVAYSVHCTEVKGETACRSADEFRSFLSGHLNIHFIEFSGIQSPDNIYLLLENIQSILIRKD